MEIRPGQLNDIDSIVNFQIDMALETEQLNLDKQVVSKGVKAIFDDHRKGIYYVVLNDEALIASCMITYEWSDWRNATIWWLQSLYVVPAWRGQGVFTKIFNYLKLQILNDDEICGLRLYVDKTNKKAQKIYTHLGMVDDHYSTFEWMKS